MTNVNLPNNISRIALSDMATVLGWCGGKGVDLLFRASRDGHTAQAFHSRCDGKGSTVVIAKTQSGHVIGGYTDVQWTSDGQYKTSNTSFIFNITGGRVPIQCHVKDQNNAVYHGSGYGPIFGDGNDFLISFSGGGSTVRCSPGSYSGSVGVEEGKEGGVVDWEVFRVV